MLCCAAIIFVLAMLRRGLFGIAGKKSLEIPSMPPLAYRTSVRGIASVTHDLSGVPPEENLGRVAQSRMNWLRVIGNCVAVGATYTLLTTSVMFIWSPVPWALAWTVWCGDVGSGVAEFVANDPAMAAMLHFSILLALSITASLFVEMSKPATSTNTILRSPSGVLVIATGTVCLLMSFADHHIFHSYLFTAMGSSHYLTLHVLWASVIASGIVVARFSSQGWISRERDISFRLTI